MSLKQLMSVPLKQLVFRKNSLPVLLGLAAFAAFLSLSGVGHSRVKQKPAAQAALPQVTVAEVIHRRLREWQEFSGRLQAVNTVEIRPRVSGYIDRVAFTDGARVKKGQLLFQIDPRPFQAEVERLVAERTRSVSDLELAKSNRARRTADQCACHLAGRVRETRGRRSLRSGSLRFDRCIVAGSAPESGIHRSARADRRPRLSRHHYRGEPRHERQSFDHARFR